MPYTTDGTPARLRMLTFMKFVNEAPLGVLLEVDGGGDPDRERQHGEHADPERAPQGVVDAAPSGAATRTAG